MTAVHPQLRMGTASSPSCAGSFSPECGCMDSLGHNHILKSHLIWHWICVCICTSNEMVHIFVCFSPSSPAPLSMLFNYSYKFYSLFFVCAEALFQFVIVVAAGAGVPDLMNAGQIVRPWKLLVVWLCVFLEAVVEGFPILRLYCLHTSGCQRTCVSSVSVRWACFLNWVAKSGGSTNSRLWLDERKALDFSPPLNLLAPSVNDDVLLKRWLPSTCDKFLPWLTLSFTS